MTKDEQSASKYLEWVKAVSSAAAAILIPVVVAVVGNRFTQAITEREVEGRFVELAIEILQEEPSEETQNLRRWATMIIDEYSGVPMSEETREELQDTPFNFSRLPNAERELRIIQESLERRGPNQTNSPSENR